MKTTRGRRETEEPPYLKKMTIKPKRSIFLRITVQIRKIVNILINFKITNDVQQKRNTTDNAESK